jgi:hypothetical protein
MSDEEPKLRAIAEEANHQIVPGARFRKAKGTTYQPLKPGPQLDRLACDFLRMLLPHGMLLWGELPRVRPPSIGVQPCETTWRSERWACEADGLLPPTTDIR